MDISVRTLLIANHRNDSNCLEQNRNFLTHVTEKSGLVLISRTQVM